MYRNPYFTDIPGIGNLNWEEIFVDDTCPVFFTLISKTGQRYISVCCEFYEEQRWLISPISNSNLIRMLKNEISLKNVFLTQNEEKCVIAHWSKDDRTLRYDIVDTCDLPEDDLPLDEMLETEDGEYAEYIERLEENDTIAYTFEILNKMRQIIAKSLSSSIVYQLFIPAPGISWEEQFKDNAHMYEYQLKRV